MSGCQDVMVEHMAECSVDVELMDFLDFQKWGRTEGNFWVDSRDAIASKNCV